MNILLKSEDVNIFSELIFDNLEWLKSAGVALYLRNRKLNGAQLKRSN